MADLPRVAYLGPAGTNSEVAALIARGLSNAEIADRLTLTPGTVANHVAHIMRRLGVKKRTQIATWATRTGLDTVGLTAGR